MFYFGYEPTDPKQVIAPVLREMGINYLRAAPSALRCIGLHTITQPGYHAYLSILPAALQASFSQSSVGTHKEGYTIMTPVSDCFPIPPTSVNFNFSAQRLTDNETQILEELGAVRHQIDGRRGGMFTIPSASPETIRTLKSTFRLLNHTTASPIGTINVSAYDQAILVIRILSGFLRTHSYPAFTTPLDSNTNHESSLEIETKRKRTTEDIGGRPSQTARMEGTADVTESEEMEVDPTSTEPDIKLYKVNPNFAANPWGPPANLPTSYGTYIPYVEDLAAPDDSAVLLLISRYFVKCLGPTMIQQSNRLEALKAGMGVIRSTGLGHVLAHLCTCISIALPAQCSVYPIFVDELYEGCAIIGAAWSLGVRGKVIYPVPSDQLAAEVINSSSHTGSLSAIGRILNPIGDITETVSRIKSMWSLHKLCMETQMSENEKISIMRHAAHLKFPQYARFRINVEALTKMFDLINHPTRFNEESPIHPNALFSNDNIELALSCFGYEAPSFKIDNGVKTKVSPADRPPTHITIKKVPLNRAVQDLKLVQTTREIEYAQPRLATTFKYRQFSGNAEKTKLWTLLTEFVDLPLPHERQPVAVLDDELDDW